MKNLRLIFLSVLVLLCFNQCNQHTINSYNPNDTNITYSGRVDKSIENEVILIGSASSAMFQFKGNQCTINLRNNTPGGLQNYFVIELDGEYQGRIRIEGDSIQPYTIQATNETTNHVVKLVKATEAANGTFSICGVHCEKILPYTPETRLNIEFIGNSITCGMGIDYEEIPCHTDQWYDQHNAYLTYGSTLARMLNANVMLSSVSGIGIYRNWNSNGPTMPQVYENQYLNTDSTKRWDFTQFTPDIVSICLGTNDFSEGDGQSERLPFDADAFTQTYIQFVSTILRHYPNTQLVLLSSPMLTGEKDQLLKSCLENVKNHYIDLAKPIQIFHYHDIVPHGCDSHPDKNDQKMMAEQLYPYFKAITDSLQ